MKRREPSDSGIGESFVIVLNEPQDIVNIAGTLRAMMNMGLTRLRLVNPALFDAHRISGIAHGSEALLERVEFFAALGDALAGGPGGRQRGVPRLGRSDALRAGPPGGPRYASSANAPRDAGAGQPCARL